MVVTFDDPPAPPKRDTSSTFVADPSDTPKPPTIAPSERTAPATSFQEDPVSNAPNTVDPPPDESIFGKAWHFLNHPILGEKASRKVASAGLLGGLSSEDIKKHREESTQAIFKGGQPLRAAWNEFRAGVAESEGRLVQGLTTPASIGLAVLSLGEYVWGDALWSAGTAGKAAVVAARTVQTGAGVGFGLQGASTALTPRQEGETEADYVERVLMSSGQVALATAGELAANKDIIRTFVRSRLHLSDNVADMVLGRLTKIAEARERQVKETDRIEKEAAQKKRAVDTKRAQRIVEVENQLDQNMRSLESQTNARMRNVREYAEQEIASLKDQVGELDRQKISQGTQVIVDAAQTLHAEKLRVQQPFQEIGDSFERPVAKRSEIKNMMLNTMKEHGAQTSELPVGATKALGKTETGETYIDTGGDIKALEVEGEDNVSFNDLSRIKDDAYSTGYASKDPVVRNAMLDAANKIDKMQESAVLDKDATKYPRKKDESLGNYRKRLIREHPQSATAKYEKAKAEYMRFKRGIGSDVVNDWLSAYDIEDQEMSGKIAKLVVKGDSFGLDKTPSPTLAIRNALRSVGVDTSAFDRTVEAMKQTRARTREVPGETTAGERGAKRTASETAQRERSQAARELREARTTATEETRAVTAEEKARTAEVVKDTEATVAEQESKGAIVKAKTTSELAGMSNEQILREQLNTMMGNARTRGIGNPSAFFMIMYGLWDIINGVKWGIVPAAYGASREFLPEVFRSPKFQDWVIRESGVEPGRERLFRKMLNDTVYRGLRRAVVGQATAATVSESRQGQPAEQITFGDPPTP